MGLATAAAAAAATCRLCRRCRRQVCQERERRYCCPRCGKLTCSLPCCLRHKKEVRSYDEKEVRFYDKREVRSFDKNEVRRYDKREFMIS